MKTYIASAIVLACALSTVQASAADFTGPRVEAHVGYDNASLAGFNQGGFAYGVGVGYDFAAASSMIVGIELNADLATTNISGPVYGYAVKISTKRDLSALVRIGSKVSDTALLYFKAGYVNGRLGLSALDLSNPANSGSEAANGNGIRGGVGLEYAVTPKAYAKFEYQYTNYESDFSRNQALVGFGFRF